MPEKTISQILITTGETVKSNAIYCGDCQNVLGNTVEFPAESVDLIYLDPPFFSNRHYEVLWGDGYELRSFEDRWKGGIENYISWMEPKLRECRRVLKSTGTLYLHCDWHANAHLRILLDSIFGANHFLNEIIWCYRGAGYPKKDFGRRHDTICRYSKGTDYTFNLDDVREEYAEATKERFKHYIGNVRKGIDFGVQKLNPKGKQPDDWWQIQPIAPSAKDRYDYPTQKPESLLERIILASSKKGDIVLDPMCGCGTTIAVAHKSKRNWIGIDVSPTACKLMVKRMHGIGVAIAEKDIIGAPKTLPQIKAMTAFEFQNWVVQKLMGRVAPRKTGDMGIDGYLFDASPIQVKQSDAIGRNVIDNFETAMKRAKKKHGVIVAFSFGKGAHEEVARAKNEDGLQIELKTVEDIMNEN